MKKVIMALMLCWFVAPLQAVMLKKHGVIATFNQTRYDSLATITVQNFSDRDVRVSPHEIEGAVLNFADLRTKVVDSRYQAFFHLFPIPYIVLYAGAFYLSEYVSTKLLPEQSIIDKPVKGILLAHAGVNFAYACQTVTTLLRKYNADGILDKAYTVKPQDSKTFIIQVDNNLDGKYVMDLYTMNEKNKTCYGISVARLEY